LLSCVFSLFAPQGLVQCLVGRTQLLPGLLAQSLAFIYLLAGILGAQILVDLIETWFEENV